MNSIATNPLEAARRQTGWAIAAGIALVLAGIVAILSPFAGAIVAVALFGWMAVVGGIFELIYAWRTRDERGTLWRIILGVLYLGVGAYVLARPVSGMVALALALGALLIARAVFLSLLAYELKHTHVWGWVGFDAVVSAGLGALVLMGWPTDSVVFLGVYFGAGLLVNGINRLIVASVVRRSLPPPATRAPPPLKPAHV
jgi:uncharacterized membrane protein HdeD (DUF308 family)